MKEKHITRVSLDEIDRMKKRGEVYHNSDAREGETLGPDFWTNAELVEPRAPQPVLLKVDPEVFAFFKAQGKGHLTKMQNVLRAYVQARKRS